MKLTIGCAYCGSGIALTLGDYSTGKLASGHHRRNGVLCAFECPACGSRTEVQLRTMRKRKGAALKAREAEETARHAERVRAQEARNDEAAKELLAQPGCACATEVPGYPYSRTRTDGLLAATYFGRGIPSPPEHQYNCPCRDTDEEREIRARYTEET